MQRLLVNHCRETLPFLAAKPRRLGLRRFERLGRIVG
jgi:hypothetical protein